MYLCIHCDCLLAWQWASQVALVKSLPASAGDIEIWVQSLGQEDPLEAEMAVHSSIFTWRIPWTGGPGKLWWRILSITLLVCEMSAIVQ